MSKDHGANVAEAFCDAGGEEHGGCLDDASNRKKGAEFAVRHAEFAAEVVRYPRPELLVYMKHKKVWRENVQRSERGAE